jgi:hypothetical protein
VLRRLCCMTGGPFRDRDLLYAGRSESPGSCQLRRCRNHVPAENVCNTEARRRPYEDHHQLARSHAAVGRHHSRHRPDWLQRLPATPHKPAVHLRGRTASRRLRALTDDHSVQYEGALRPRIAPPESSPSTIQSPDCMLVDYPLSKPAGETSARSN